MPPPDSLKDNLKDNLKASLKASLKAPPPDPAKEPPPTDQDIADEAREAQEKAYEILAVLKEQNHIRPVAKVMGFTGNRYCDSMMRALEALSSCRSLTHNTFYTSANSAV